LNNNEFNGDAGDEEILKLNVSGKRKRNAILSQEESELISIISNSISSQSSKYSSSTNSVISSKISTPKSCHNDKKLHVLTPMVLLEKLSPESLKKWPISNMQQVSQQLERYLKFGLDKGKVLPMPPSLEDSIEVKKKTKDQKPKNVKKLKKSLNNNIQINPADRAHACQECGKQFTKRDHLTQHMITHSSATPYKCKLCNKAYKHVQSLRHHEKSHSASAAASSSASAAHTQISAVDLSVGGIFWAKCDRYPWWPCMIIGRLLTTDQKPHYKMEGTKKMWLVWLLGGLEYAWVATGGLIAYTQLRDVPSFTLEWHEALDVGRGY
jgi:hypothetical protein